MKGMEALAVSLWNVVQATFPAKNKPQRKLSIDEAMVAYKGRSHLQQYMPNKPIKWGLKIWMIAEAATGYILDFEPYFGKPGAAPAQLTVPGALNPGGVLVAAPPAAGKFHKIDLKIRRQNFCFIIDFIYGDIMKI